MINIILNSEGVQAFETKNETRKPIRALSTKHCSGDHCQHSKNKHIEIKMKRLENEKTKMHYLQIKTI